MRRLITLCAALPALALLLQADFARGVDPRKTTPPGATASVLPGATTPANITPSSTATPPTAPTTPAAATPATTGTTATTTGVRTRTTTTVTTPATAGAGGTVSAQLAPTPTPSPNTPVRPPKWRIGVYSQDTNYGVKILRVVTGSPAERAGLEAEDVIVTVGGYQVGLVNGVQYDCGYEFENRCDPEGKVVLLVRDHRNGNLVNLPIQLESRLQKISGEVAYRNRIGLPADAVATVELREVRVDTPPITIGRQSIEEIRRIPIPFTIEYDPLDVDTRRQYVIHAAIQSGNRVLYSTQQQYAVNLGTPNQTVSVAVEAAPQNTQTAASDRLTEIERQIVQWFKDYLGRDPQPHELPLWTAQVTERGRSMADVQAELLTNEQVFNLCDRDKARYIQFLSQQIAGKSPTQEELEYWLWKFDQSGERRLDIARAFQAGVAR